MKNKLKRAAASVIAAVSMASCMYAPLSNAGISFEIPKLSAFAESEDLSYNGFSYQVGDSGITITSYTGSDKEVVIPEEIDGNSVIAIGSSAFAGNTAIISVTIPDSVVTIGNSSFKDCSNLASIEIPPSVDTIGSQTFAGCTNLADITLNEGLKAIDYRAFDGTPITEIYIPSTLESASYSFYGCESLIYAEFAEGITTIPNGFFNYCKSLQTVKLPETAEEIGDYAFANCEKLSKIISERESYTFKSHSFENCYSLNDKRFSLLDKTNSYLIANADVSSVNGLVNYTVKYKLMDNVAASASDYDLEIIIPDGMVLLPDSFKSTDSEFSIEDSKNGIISISKPQGTLSFSARINEYGDYNVNAFFNFYYMESRWNQRIGTLEVDVPELTVNTANFTNELNAEVYGIAEKGETVR